MDAASNDVLVLNGWIQNRSTHRAAAAPTAPAPAGRVRAAALSEWLIKVSVIELEILNK